MVWVRAGRVWGLRASRLGLGRGSLDLDLGPHTACRVCLLILCAWGGRGTNLGETRTRWERVRLDMDV